MSARVEIRFLPNIDTVIIKKNEHNNIFITTSDSIIISRVVLESIVKSMFTSNILSADFVKKITKDLKEVT
jgi:hypothetical protein